MSEPVKFLLHIGANKTGTSSIQTMLANSGAALARAGWIYPDFHRSYGAHHALAFSIRQHPRLSLPEGWQADFARLTAPDDRRFIFSSELFFRVVPPAWTAQYFPPGRTRVVLYLRDHLGYMMSWYAQAIQERNLTASFQDYVRVWSRPLTSYLAPWEQVYGRGNVVLRTFSRATLAGGDVRRDFIDLIEGADPADFDLSAADSNLSLSGNLLFFKKLLNNYMTAEEARTHPIPEEFGALVRLKDSFRGRFAATKAEVDVVRQLFAADREDLLQRGLQFEPMPDAVAGHASPDLDTLTEDMRLIKQVAVKTRKQFLTYADRWQDWHRL
jgi:hypothetical protein